MKKKTSKQNPAVGRFIGHARGFAFITADGGDLFVPPDKTGGALHGDTVEYSLTKPRRTAGAGRQEAEVTSVVRRGDSPKVGTCFSEGKKMYVSPLDGRIPYVFHVTAQQRNKFALVDGHRVLYFVKKTAPGGKCTINEVIGHANDPGVDILSLVKQSGIPYVFPQEVTDAATEIPQIVSADDIRGRLDLRGRMIFTVDGEDTKDIDDAVSICKTENGLYELGVHIADVSSYVAEGGVIDREALRRGNSVYLADRVIPMLPHALSNGICSLNPGEDRLAVSVFMTFGADGTLTEHVIAPSVICSEKKWTYERVRELLYGDSENAAITDEEEKFLPSLKLMDELRKILSAKRKRRGALSIESPEAKIKLDETGRTVSVEKSPHNEATEIIEEFMIACNETVAGHFTELMMPFVYRSHEPPEREKLKWLDTFVREFGYSLKGKTRSQSTLQALADAAYGRPEYAVVSNAILRCQQKAVYSTNLPSHFGLASECYCHFTSPIRRYADLQVHRIIREYFNHGNAARFSVTLPEVAAHVSETERAAEALEREVDQLKKVQFMRGREGEIFEGVVTSAVNGGFYVTLPNTVEGFAPKEAQTEKRGRRHRKETKPVKLGSAVKVKLMDVDEEANKLKFRIKSVSESAKNIPY